MLSRPDCNHTVTSSGEILYVQVEILGVYLCGKPIKSSPTTKMNVMMKMFECINTVSTEITDDRIIDCGIS